MFFYKLKFKNKIMLSITIVLMLSILVLTMLFYNLLRKNFQEKLRTTYYTNIIQLANQLSYIYKDLRNTANNASSSSEIIALINNLNKETDVLKKFSIKQKIQNNLPVASTNYPIVYDTILCSVYGDLFLSGGQDLFFSYRPEDFISQRWFTKNKYDYNDLGWDDYTNMFDKDISGPYFYIIRIVKDTQNGNHLGTMRIGFSHKFIMYMLKDVLADSQTICIINRQGHVIASNRKGDIGSRLEIPAGTINTQFIENKQIYFLSSIEDTPWYVVGIAALSDLSVQNDAIFISVIITAAICLLISIALSYFVSLSTTNPINKLVAAVNRIKSGDFNINLQLSTQDEIRILGDAIQDMASKLTDLMENIIKKEEEKREAEIKFLRAQITPHFLHNTLKTITALAQFKRTDEINQIIISLTKILKESMASDAQMIELNQEIGVLQNYLLIMEIRYNYSFDFSIDINPFLNDICIPRLTLQPIIENSIFHGMVIDDSRPFHIYVDVNFLDDNRHLIKIKIRDNGRGISPDKLRGIQDAIRIKEKSKNSHQSSIGIYNVMQRLKYYFDDPQILINSVVDEGTTVEIIFQIKRGEMQ